MFKMMCFEGSSKSVFVGQDSLKIVSSSCDFDSLINVFYEGKKSLYENLSH